MPEKGWHEPTAQALRAQAKAEAYHAANAATSDHRAAYTAEAVRVRAVACSQLPRLAAALGDEMPLPVDDASLDELLGADGCSFKVVPSERYVSEGERVSFRALAKPEALRIAAASKGEACDNNLLHMEAELNAPADAAGGPPRAEFFKLLILVILL